MQTFIAHAETNSAILRCYPVMVQLRPHLQSAEFVERVTRQLTQGYRLAYLEAEGEVRAVAGYRFLENLAWGKFCYVDDLVTDAAARSHGFGRTLLAWLVAQARETGCDQFHLDSGVHRFAAHRFYLTQRMDITCHHFAMSLRD
ncbi:MAG TPA: GNAT family N-acetyltransferase [Pirellulales bacterium]